MPMNILHNTLHHPFVNADELPFPSVVLPGGGRLGIFPAVRARHYGPSMGFGPGMIGMPHPLGSHLGMGAGMGIDSTAASWRRYAGIGGLYTGYPLGYRLPGRMGEGGFFGGWSIRD